MKTKQIPQNSIFLVIWSGVKSSLNTRKCQTVNNVLSCVILVSVPYPRADQHGCWLPVCLWFILRVRFCVTLCQMLIWLRLSVSHMQFNICHLHLPH